jgi:hypothetical protein
MEVLGANASRKYQHGCYFTGTRRLKVGTPRNDVRGAKRRIISRTSQRDIPAFNARAIPTNGLLSAL